VTTAELRIDPSNREQLRAWDGGEGAFWAANAEQYDRALAAYQEVFSAAAAIGSADRILDIGCGTGQTTRDAARVATSGSALGVDLSSEMIAVARSRADAEGLTNARFLQADVQIHDFGDGAFDVGISRTGAMFFGDPTAAFANIARALTVGGRLALLAWQPVASNEWFRAFFSSLAAGRDLSPPPRDAPGPFALSEPDRVRTILTSAGFSEVTLQPALHPMHFGADAADAYAFVIGQLGWLVADLDDATRNAALEQLRTNLAAHATTEGVLYDSATWVITAIRR
jgi:SAM-dependent methyltransferase